MGVERLAASLTRLQDALEEVRLPLDVPQADENRELVSAQAHQITDYVLPRLRRLDAPLLAVVGGSTGAGKSTLVNTLIGREVTEAGVIRPTTRSSVLVHHPEDARWFESSQILPGLARSDTPVTDPRVLQLVPEPSLPKGLAILDAPDVDSVVAQNRTLAAQLLAAADLWLFVTSAARYADAVPWQYLRSAARRKAVVAVVLDRVPPAAMADVPPHLGQMMSQRGLSASPLFAVPETGVDDKGLLPYTAIGPIRGWLADLAEDTVRRNQVVLQTLDGAIESLAVRGPEVAAAVEAQVEALDTLRADAQKSFAEAARAVAAQTADGTMLRGEVLARWQDFVGTGELFRAVEKRIGLFRDRLAQVAKGEPKKAHDVQLAVESGLEILIREEGEFAARRVVSAWEAHPAGRQLLARDGALGKVSADFNESAARVVREWQGDVLELVSNEGTSKKATARYLALGVNGAGVALMVFVFSQTGGLVGAELGVAGGTALLAQRVLEAVFGEDAVRRLAKQAKSQLDGRVEALMAVELDRFFKLVDEVEVRAGQGDELSAALAGLETERLARDRYIREVTPTPGLPESDIEPAGLVAAPDASTDADPADADLVGAVLDDAEGVDRAWDAEEDLRSDLTGDTGLLPELVSAQLSALVADVSRHDEEPQPASGDEPVSADETATDQVEADVETERDDDPASPSEEADPAFESESEQFAKVQFGNGESGEESAADLPGDVERPAAVEPEVDIQPAVVEPPSQPESAESGHVDDPQWRIPVPSGLAALAAEAVRRPDEPVIATATDQPEPSAAEHVEAVEQAKPTVTDQGEPDSTLSEVVEPVSGVVLPEPPALPHPPLPHPPLSHPPMADDGDVASLPAAEKAEAGVAGLPSPPVLPSVPAFVAGSPSSLSPIDPGVELPALPVLPVAPAAGLSAISTMPIDVDHVPVQVLVPPAQIPPPPPVPRWPAPEADPDDAGQE
jgi:hypothetical protein